MLEKTSRRKTFPAVVRLPVILGVMSLAVQIAQAQGPAPAAPLNPSGSQATLWRRFSDGLSVATAARPETGRHKLRESSAGEPVPSASPAETKPVRSGGVRRITLEQVKQQAVDPSASPFARLGQLSIEAAKQHRLGVQADYFPKLGASIFNLHFSEFLGEVVSVRRPIEGSLLQVPIPLFSQNQTIAAVTFVQPITPLFKVYQAVQIARADERIAMAKAAVPSARNNSETQLEETYFRLLIAKCQLISAEWRLRNTDNQPLFASASNGLVHAPGLAPELFEAKKALATAAAAVKELTASLNRVMGWPDETELELAPPDPLVESISLEEVNDKSVSAGANPEVFEAEQTVIKAQAASVLSKLDYVPTVAAIGGFLFQNAIPLVPNNFGYGGVMVSYNLFDFGKRERAVKEARAQLGMAEMGVQLTKAKIAANIKKTYFELERSRQLSQVAQKMGSSVSRLMNVSANPDSMEGKSARAEVEMEMLEADLVHREAFARLKALMGSQQ